MPSGQEIGNCITLLLQLDKSTLVKKKMTGGKKQRK